MKPPGDMESGTSSGLNVAASCHVGDRCLCPRHHGLASNPGPVLSLSLSLQSPQRRSERGTTTRVRTAQSLVP